jgi:hypothetical protein
MLSVPAFPTDHKTLARARDYGSTGANVTLNTCAGQILEELDAFANRPTDHGDTKRGIPI